MTARQAETILMLSDFLENAQVVILSIVRIENQRLMSCVKTLCSNLQCLFVLWLKALQVYPMISIKDMSIGYGHVCDEHNGRY
jgi:hypothetical protein